MHTIRMVIDIYLNGQVVFGIGECTKSITIPIIADSERESNEILNVELKTDCT